MMDIRNYYTQQGFISDPGKYAYLYDELPDDVPTLCGIVQDLFFHYADEGLFNCHIPTERMAEMNNRYVYTMLETIIEKNSKPLYVKRRTEERHIGICRDMCLLVCSILRYKNIPARLRMGFIDHLSPGIYLDTLLVEYFDEKQQRWILANARITKNQLQKLNLKLEFDVYDIPENQFFSAEAMWKHCRENKINPQRVGYGQYRGLWYVRNRLLQAMAFLTKKELLIWDVWGIMLGQEPAVACVAEEHLPFLDNLSNFLLENAYSIEALQSYYQANKTIQVANKVMVYNPFINPVEVEVRL